MVSTGTYRGVKARTAVLLPGCPLQRRALIEAETSSSASELVNKAVREAPSEDAKDIKAFEEKAG